MGKNRFAGRAVAVVSAVVAVTAGAVAPAGADDRPPPTPGMEVADDSGQCTAGFAATDSDGNHYLLTSGHCDGRDGSLWTYGDDIPLGYITASQTVGDVKDAAIIRLLPDVAVPEGNPRGSQPVRDVLTSSRLALGMPFCKTGAVTGETCGEITAIDGDVVEASVYSLEGDSGSPGYVTNPDGTISAVGLLMSSPEDDDEISYFALVAPLLDEWDLTILE